MAGQPIPITQEDIDNRFDFHGAMGEKAERHSAVRTLLKRTAENLLTLIPPGRDASRAIADLEDAMFHANAAIAREAPETA